MPFIKLKNSTELTISRGPSPGNIASSETFTTTLGQALRDNDFDTNSGTMTVRYDLTESAANDLGPRYDGLYWHDGVLCAAMLSDGAYYARIDRQREAAETSND